MSDEKIGDSWSMIISGNISILLSILVVVVVVISIIIP